MLARACATPSPPLSLSQDFSWRSQITKENERHLREKAQVAARLASGDHSSTNVEIESAKRIFGDSNLVTKMAQRKDPDHTGLAVRAAHQCRVGHALLLHVPDVRA